MSSFKAKDSMPKDPYRRFLKHRCNLRLKAVAQRRDNFGRFTSATDSDENITDIDEWASDSAQQDTEINSNQDAADYEPDAYDGLEEYVGRDSPARSASASDVGCIDGSRAPGTRQARDESSITGTPSPAPNANQYPTPDSNTPQRKTRAGATLDTSALPMVPLLSLDDNLAATADTLGSKTFISLKTPFQHNGSQCNNANATVMSSEVVMGEDGEQEVIIKLRFRPMRG